MVCLIFFSECYAMHSFNVFIPGMFDKDKKGQITFQDFGALWKYVTDWQSCFRSFDKDNSGNIDKLELLSALQTFGYRLSMETVDNIVKKFDRGGQEKIYFDDFIQACVLLHYKPDKVEKQILLSTHHRFPVGVESLCR
ncbi:Programmed cell death protein 6 [Homalodisca vitripennis]|nr:Programmed cell death protein 6 [Homalodisca vitripennis]KAG8277098.1 Programmed cell death protein 6 [Homalodisca vitripennis]